MAMHVNACPYMAINVIARSQMPTEEGLLYAASYVGELGRSSHRVSPGPTRALLIRPRIDLATL